MTEAITSTKVVFRDSIQSESKGMKNIRDYYKEREERMITKKTYMMILLLSLLISIFGGCMLGWWLHKYHPSNKHLWMVPFSLILFLTPAFVWFSIFISDFCISKIDDEQKQEQGMVMMNHHQIHPLDQSL
ncbi:hypothetical protein HN51_046425 [Arachis hypogaea]|nr:uncharacterized protein DS421_12g356410 [Arachis hypogaea]QHO22571.1 uncharacterized protein DS421_12g356410 [Arachis hypogaea]